MKKIILFTIIIFSFGFIKAQDVHFSQFNETPLLLNPALTGAFKATHRIIGNYKSQWKSIANKSYSTFALSYDAGLLKKKSKTGFLGLGFYVYNDRAGDAKLNTTQFNVSIAYHLLANNNNSLTLGIQGGMINKTINKSGLKWDNQYDPSAEGGYNAGITNGETVPFNSNTNLDVAAGFMWTYNSNPSSMINNDGVKINLGLSGYHLNCPNISLIEGTSRMNPRITLHTNMFLGINGTNLGLLPSAFASVQGSSKEIVFGTFARYKIKSASHFTRFETESAASLGAFYRVGDAIIVAAMFEYKNFNIGLSYDVNVSKLSQASKGRGGVEISLKYIAPLFEAKNKSLF